jgi:DNA-binding NtrC family response regulator
VEKLKAIVVDDEPDIVELMEMFLEEHFQVMSFTDPRLAADAIKNGHFDLLVSDVKMPHLTGYDLLRLAGEVKPKMAVVIMTGHAQTLQEKGDMVKLGAFAVLPKPFGSPSEIVKTAQDAVNSKMGTPGVSKVPTAVPGIPVTSSAQTAEAPLTPSAHADLSAQSGGDRISILAVDDEEELLEILGMMLEDQFHVVVQTDPSKSLALMDSHSFQAAIVDLNMPKMKGKDLMKAMHERCPGMKLIIASGHSEKDPEVEEAMKVGAIGLIPKPYPDGADLVTLIRKYLA